MSFDARSLERISKPGRQLCEPQPAVGSAPRVSENRRKLETETDPEAQSRELMQVSVDGTLPPQPIDRLRRVEKNQQLRRREERLRQEDWAGVGSPSALRQGERPPQQELAPARRQRGAAALHRGPVPPAGGRRARWICR